MRLSINRMGLGFFSQAGSLGVKLEASNTCNCRRTKQSSGVNDKVFLSSVAIGDCSTKTQGKQLIRAEA
jgi:hypothetical protein